MTQIDVNKLKTMKTAEQLLTEKYGAEGTESRAQFNDRANAWYYGELLRSRRKELNMTQQQLADKVGTARSYIARVEHGQNDIQLSSFIRIANALRLDFVPIPL